MDASLRSIVPAAASVRIDPRPRQRQRGDRQRFARELLQSGVPLAGQAPPENKHEVPASAQGEPGSTLDVVG